jgi:FkbM family methyltransferase
MIAIPRAIARIPILRGAVRLLLTAYMRVAHGRYSLQRRLGLSLLLDWDNIVDRELMLSGTWEKERVDRLFELADKARRSHVGGAIFLDVGAHWGLYALLAHRTGWFERIVALEPDPTNFAQLQANLFLNGAEAAIEPLQLAASDSERTFQLARRVDINRGATKLVAAAGTGHATCRAVRADKLLDIAGKLLVIKIDVEDHEVAAIAGLEDLLARNRCVIMAEIDDSTDPGRPKAIANKLAAFGIGHVGSISADHFFVSGDTA